MKHQGEVMKRSSLLSWALVLLTAVACSSTPTPPPATAAVPATQPATAVSTQAVATVPIATTPATASTEAANPTTDATASPTDANITPGAVRTVAAGEVVKLAGNSFTTSDTYRFSADTTLDITWNYTGTASFALWLVNASDVVTDPNYDRILVDDVTGPHTGSAKTKIIAGDWTVQVEQAEGPWTVEFQPES
jgi:hypothetical protein